MGAVSRWGYPTELFEKVDIMAEVQDETTAPKKIGVCQKGYIMPNGETSRSTHPEAVALGFKFGNGKTETVELGKFPADIELQLNWFGRSEKFGNFYAGAKGDADKAHEMFLTGRENLANGEWSERGGGEGERPSMVVDAVVAALEAAGETVDEGRKATIHEKVKTKEGRKAALANPAINAEYERVRAAKAKAKADAAKKAAKEEGADLSAF